MKHLSALLSLILLPACVLAQTSGQNVIQKKSASAGFTYESFTLGNSQLIGRTSGGTLSGISIGSGLSLSGTTLSSSASSTWGSITGTLSSQTDLQTALDAKASTASLSSYLTTATAASTYAPLASPTFTGTISGASLSLSGGISVTGSIATGSGNFETTAGNISTGSGIISGNGSGISALNASNISSGTLAIARIADGSITTAKITGLAASATTDTTSATNITSGSLSLRRLAQTAATTGQVMTYHGGRWRPLDDLNDYKAIAKVTLPCDAVPGALAAWGLVPLKNSAIGANAFKLRKTADSTTSDFTFSSRATPTSTVDAWKGTETTYNARKACFDTIYDQIGTNHLTQATTTAQPAWLELPDGQVVAAMNGDNLARDAFFSIPDASWTSRNITVFHVQIPNERTWSGSSSELFVNQLNFGWSVTGGYTGLSGAESPTNRAIARQWYGGSYADTPLRQGNAAPQILAVRYNSTNTTLSLHDGTRITTTVQPSGTLTAGAIGRLAGFALYSRQANWLATLVYPSLTDDEMAAVFAALRARFNLNKYTHNIVCDGDSITAGHNESEGSYDVRTTSWPWLLRTTLADPRLKITNVAISSQTLVTLETAAAVKVDGQISATDFGTNNILIIFAGTNDINAGADSATAISRLTTYVNNRRAAGWNRILICTAIPRENFNSTQNTHLAAYNAFIVANSLGADAVVNLAALSWSYSTHYQGSTPNRIHPNAAGRALIVGAVQTALASLSDPVP